MMKAAEHGNVHTLEHLVDTRADVNATRTVRTQSLLHPAFYRRLYTFNLFEDRHFCVMVVV